MQQLQSAVRDLERQREEERVRGEGERGEEERGEEVVREALHRPPLSEDEYLALRGRGEEEGKERERDTQALADYVRVSRVVSTSLTQCSHCAGVLLSRLWVNGHLRLIISFCRSPLLTGSNEPVWSVHVYIQ